VTSAASIGECMIELSAGEGDTCRMGFAGDAFNLIWSLRAFLPDDWTTDFVTAFGDDPFSDRQREFMARVGIGGAHSPVFAGARPGLYAITLEAGERSFTYWRSDSAARRLADSREALDRSVQGRDLVFFSGVTLAILDDGPRENLFAALRLARASGSRLAFDPNWRPRLWASPDAARIAVTRALQLAHIALPTFSDEAALFGDATPDATVARLRAVGVAEIVVKAGPSEALVAGAEGSASVAALPVRAPVDTTGAGDAFNGSYLAARLRGAAPREAAHLGHRAAAAVVRLHGALAPHDTLRAAVAAGSID
jgi:2-dehydro-3-deoxygluconokinase